MTTITPGTQKFRILHILRMYFFVVTSDRVLLYKTFREINKYRSTANEMTAIFADSLKMA